MSRPLRIDYPGAWHHVMHRSPSHRAVFPSSIHRWQFLDLLNEVHHDFALEVHAYCLMEDGYELLTRTPKANLSRAMRHLNGVYTQAFNRLQCTGGSLFQGRFKSILLDGDTYLSRVTRYIHRRPVDIDLVLHPEDYPCSSYPAYLGKVSAPDWLQTDATLMMFGHQEQRKHYRCFVEAGVDEELRRFYSGGRMSHILGTRAFCERLSQTEEGGGGAATVDAPDGAQRLDMDSITAATARFFAVDIHSLRHAQRGKRNLPRAVAMALCHQPGGYSLEEVAKAFGVGSLAAVSLAIYRLKTRLRDAPDLSGEMDALRRQLF